MYAWSEEKLFAAATLGLLHTLEVVICTWRWSGKNLFLSFCPDWDWKKKSSMIRTPPHVYTQIYSSLDSIYWKKAGIREGLCRTIFQLKEGAPLIINFTLIQKGHWTPLQDAFLQDASLQIIILMSCKTHVSIHQLRCRYKVHNACMWWPYSKILTA